MLTDASNIFSDNIASLEHGKPIWKTACTFSYALHIRQNFERVRLILRCNEVKTSLEVAVNWREEEKMSDTRFEIEKNAAKEEEKFVARWRNWQCLVVVCAVKRNWHRVGGWESLVRMCVCGASVDVVRLVCATKPWHSFIFARCLRSLYNSKR